MPDHVGRILVATGLLRRFEAALPPEHRIVATRADSHDDSVTEVLVRGPMMPIGTTIEPATAQMVFTFHAEAVEESDIRLEACFFDSAGAILGLPWQVGAWPSIDGYLQWLAAHS